MSPQRARRALILCAALFGAAVLLAPLPAIELLGVPLIVAAAYVGGLRSGLLMALWAVVVATAGYFVLSRAEPVEFILSLVIYAAVATGLGLGVDRFAARGRRLQDAVERAAAARRQLEASQRRYRLLFEVSNDVVYLHGLDGQGEPTRFVAVNDTACRSLGYTREELLGLTPRAIDGAPTPGQLRGVMRELLQRDHVVYEGVRRQRDGTLTPVEVSSSLTDVDGELLVLSISRDITGRKQAEERLEMLSLHDELTGLLNRRGFRFLLPELRKRAKRAGSRVAVLYADVDGFKAINDAHGHRRGDEVLVAVADALRSTFRETDLLARLGGDEFCVVAEMQTDPDVEVLAARLDASLRAASRGFRFAVSLSHGVLTSDWRGLEDADALVARADELMYADKTGRRRYRYEAGLAAPSGSLPPHEDPARDERWPASGGEAQG